MIGKKLNRLRSLCSYVLHGSETLSVGVPLVDRGHHPGQAGVAATVGDDQDP